MDRKNTLPAAWTVRNRLDPAGTAVIVDRGNSGKSALKLTCSEQGKTMYVFQRLCVEEMGTYEFAAFVKSASSRPVSVSLHTYDMTARRESPKATFTIEPGRPYTRIRARLEYEKTPQGFVAAIVALNTPGGSVLVDDVTFTKR